MVVAMIILSILSSSGISILIAAAKFFLNLIVAGYSGLLG